MWYNNIFGNIPLPNGIIDKNLTKFETDREFLNNFNNLLTNCLEIFQWDLPETCNPRFLELSLIYRGQALFAYENGSLINLAASNSGDFNVYGEPLKMYGYGLNGWNKEYNMYIPGSSETNQVLQSVSGRTLKNDFDAVLCRDNAISYPYFNYLIMGAQRLTKMLRSIDVTTLNLKQPVLITCEESYKNSVEKVLNDVYSNKPYIIGVKGFNSKFADFNTIDLKQDPNTLNSMWMSYDKYDSIIKNILGIDCISNVNKKAQMLSGELSENNMNLEYSLDKRLAYRKKACEQIYDCFGIYCDVKLKHDIEKDEFIPQDSLTEVNEYEE